MSKEFEDNYEMFDALVEFMGLLPKATVKVLDTEKYMSMAKTATTLKGMLKKTMAEGQMDIAVDPDFNMGSITVEMDSLTIEDTRLFAAMISAADNFEIYPLTNGNIRMDITFQGVLKSIA